jgi:copper homeostasis protein
MPFLEICVDDVGGARAALQGGAERIELCSALDVGGLTPSLGFAAFAASLGIPIRPMIRPRAGSFVFDADEERVMREDIVRMMSVGVEGVVLGASHADGRLNVGMLERLVDVARKAGARGLTLHRAIDLAPDLEQAVDEAAKLGFDTVLSSGGALTATQGASMLARMRQRAPSTLTIMAGSGVTPATVGPLVAATGVTAVHASGRSHLRHADPKLVTFGFSPAVEKSATAETVRALRNALDRL